METIVDHVLKQGSCANGSCDSVGEAVYAPTLDVVEDQNGYSLYFDLPGVASDGLKVELIEDKLHLSANRIAETLAEGAVVHRSERARGKFVRAVRMPKQVDAERIEAELKDGVLHVRLPKIPKPTTRQIEIRSTN